MPTSFIDKKCNTRRPTITKSRGSELATDVVVYSDLACDFWVNSGSKDGYKGNNHTQNADKEAYEVIFKPWNTDINKGDIIELIDTNLESIGKFVVFTVQAQYLPGGKLDSFYLFVTSR